MSIPGNLPIHGIPVGPSVRLVGNHRRSFSLPDFLSAHRIVLSSLGMLPNNHQVSQVSTACVPLSAPFPVESASLISTRVKEVLTRSSSTGTQVVRRSTEDSRKPVVQFPENFFSRFASSIYQPTIGFEKLLSRLSEVERGRSEQNGWSLLLTCPKALFPQKVPFLPLQSFQVSVSGQMKEYVVITRVAFSAFNDFLTAMTHLQSMEKVILPDEHLVMVDITPHIKARKMAPIKAPFSLHANQRVVKQNRCLIQNSQQLVKRFLERSSLLAPSLISEEQRNIELTPWQILFTSKKYSRNLPSQSLERSNARQKVVILEIRTGVFCKLREFLIIMNYLESRKPTIFPMSILLKHHLVIVDISPHANAPNRRSLKPPEVPGEKKPIPPKGSGNGSLSWRLVPIIGVIIGLFFFFVRKVLQKGWQPNFLRRIT